MWFKRKSSYIRAEVMEEAGRAAAKGRLKKAIAGYRRVLEIDPADLEAHSRIAPLLAKAGELDESWKSFKAAGEAYRKRGFLEKAASVYAQAARYMPKESEIWENISNLQLERGLKADAVDALIAGHRHFKGRALRDKSIRLLKKAWAIEPWRYDVTTRLAKLLGKSGRKDEAMGLLCGLADRTQGGRLRRVRGAVFLLSPGLSSAWMWLRAAVYGR